MKTMTVMRSLLRWLLPGALAAFVTGSQAQTLAWEQTKYFQYNIENVTVSPAAAPGSWLTQGIFTLSVA